MKIKTISFFCGLLTATLQLLAQPGRNIIIQTAHLSMILSSGTNGRLYQCYLGERLIDPADYKLGKQNKEVYITGGMEDQFQPAIRITHADGNPSLELIYDSYEVIPADGRTRTIIKMHDPQYAITVRLYYDAFDRENVIKTWTEITNNEQGIITLNNYASSMLHFDADAYWLTQFHGDWASEMKMQESKLTTGTKEIDSKLGTRPDGYQSQVFMLALNKSADETSGQVLAGTLGWTGNYQFLFEIDQHNSLRVISGINPYASAYQLDKGKTFSTPPFIFTYSAQGKGQASRNLHAWARNYDIMDGNKPRPVVYNNWETTETRFTEEKLAAMFADAHKLGTDVFLLDDGWFGNKYPRSDDKAGLGDWQETKTKLPNGIGNLVKLAGDGGIKFGIWVEPEMVNPKSELFEHHPDWVLKLPNRADNYQRHQLVLDLPNPKVQDFVFNVVDGLISKNPGLAFFKWDCNRYMTNAWSPYLKDRQSNLYVDYVLGLYKVWQRLHEKYPHLPMMLCSSGGGRMDYNALQYFTDFWASDNTDPVERVYIQWGYSNFVPSLAIASHVTSWGSQSLKFRTDVAMMDKLGYDIDISKMTADELAFSQQAITNYRRLNEIIFFGDLFRLVSPYEQNRAVLMYVNSAKSKAVLFNYNLNIRQGESVTHVRLQGLDAQKLYKVEELNLMPGAKPLFGGNGQSFSGDYLMKAGLDLDGEELKALTSSILELTAL